MKNRMLHLATVGVALGLASQVSSAELPLPRDGWASWQIEPVASVEGAPAWCCWGNGDKGTDAPKACKLDDNAQGHGTRNHETTDSVRVYARFKGGKVERVRALSATCPVEAGTPIQMLENVTTEDSARWLTALTRGEHEYKEDAIAALAIHRGDVAMNALTGLARADTSVETRERAIFWLAMLRGPAGADVVSTSMFNDKDPEVRNHAAFAITQSKSTHIAADLIRLGNTDADGEVRSQAWFWLAHTGAANAEAAIIAAALKDQDEEVREQGIFALSQLPEERATRALIAAVEDRSLSQEQRKRALFWLAQSESTSAQAYLDKVLLGKAGRQESTKPYDATTHLP